MSELGNYLREVREAKGYSIRYVAEKSGVSNAYISQIETGKRANPHPNVLRNISEALNISYIYLMKKAGYLG